jgi:hypothetical protein
MNYEIGYFLKFLYNKSLNACVSWVLLHRRFHCIVVYCTAKCQFTLTTEPKFLLATEGDYHKYYCN